MDKNEEKPVVTRLFIKRKGFDLSLYLCAVMISLLIAFYNIGYSKSVGEEWNITFWVFCFSVFAFAFVLFIKYRKKNNLIKNGKLVWAKIDHSKTQDLPLFVLFYAHYKSENDYAEYTEAMALGFTEASSRKVDQMRKTKYVPVFVSPIDLHDYAMILRDSYYTEDEVEFMKNKNSIIRMVEHVE